MIPELADLLKDSVLETLEERVSISFSGGIDSTLIASVAKNASDVELYTVGMAGAKDVLCADEVANMLKLPIEHIRVDEKDILDTFDKCYQLVPNNLLKVELLVPVYKAAQKASEQGQEIILFGAGAEELFVGYERYYHYLEEGKDLDKILQEEFRTLDKREIGWINKICREFSIEARYPFHNRKLADFVFSIPLERRMENRELKKSVLREAATLMQVPPVSVKRKKQAMQYGSGIHKVLMKHADELNKKYPGP